MAAKAVASTQMLALGKDALGELFMGGSTQGGVPKKRLSPTATCLVKKAVLSFSGLFASTFFADEIVNSTTDDYGEDYTVLRKLVTSRRYANNGSRQGRFDDKMFCRMIDAENHSELCNTLIVLANYDIALNTALEHEGVPDDGLFECLWAEIYSLVGRERERAK